MNPEKAENIEQITTSAINPEYINSVEDFTSKEEQLLASHKFNQEKDKAHENDQEELFKIRASLGLEQAGATKDLKQYLQEYLELKDGDAEKIGLLKAKDLPQNYQSQREALDDKRLDNVTIAVVPDDLWVKGSQPSESSADKQMILIKQSYFEAQEKPDEIAWMIHELAHCQNFLDSATAEDYEKNMQKFAFTDLKIEYSYPNNPVEQYTFTKQFQFLKDQGKGREDIMEMLDEYYHKEDSSFFNRLLDDIYGK